MAALVATPALLAATGSGTSGTFGLPSGCPSGDRKVVVLVRGLKAVPVLFSAQEEDNPRYWTRLEEQLPSDEFEIWRCDTVNSLGGHEQNASAIGSYISQKISERGSTPADISIVAHSMGGLMTRAYINGNYPHNTDISRVITLGTPHCGSQIADIGNALAGKYKQVVNLLWPATEQLTESYMQRNFNTRVSYRGDTKFYFLGGFGGPLSSSGFYQACSLFLGQSDGMVSLRSSHGSYRGGFWTGFENKKQVWASNSSRGREYLYEFVDDHTQLKKGEGGVIGTLKNILRNQAPEPSAPSYSGTGLLAEASEPGWQAVGGAEGQLQTAGLFTHAFPVDGVSKAAFSCVTPNGDARVTLIAPGGARIEAGTLNPSVVFSEQWEEFGRTKTFEITNPAPGEWSVEVYGQAMDPAGEPYVVEARVQSYLALLPQTPYVQTTASPAVISAKLDSNGTGLPGQTVTAFVADKFGTGSDLTLYDDGAHSDGAAGDGVYANTTAITTAGFYSAALTATGTSGGNPFRRMAPASLQVANPTASLGTTFSDQPVNTGGGAGFDTLRVSVLVNVVSGSKFTVAAALTSGEAEVVRAVATRTGCVTGANTFNLDFSGAELREKGVPGPYTLTGLTLFDDLTDPPLIVQEGAGGYVTSTSNPAAFNDGTPPSGIVDLTVTGTGPSSVTLTWSSPVDDTAATAYEMRIGPDPVSLVTWEASTPVAGLPAPKGKNEPQTFTVTGLSAGTWYFGIRSRDAAGNWSQVSNSPMATLQASAAPATGTITPSSGSVVTGVKQSFTATFSDGDGHGDIADCRVLLNTALQGANGIFLRLDRTNNKLYLRSDNNSGWLGGHAPGSGNVIENGRCTIHCDRTTFSGNGNTLTLNISLTLKPLVAGKTLTEWLYVGDAAGHGDGWNQAGEITVASAPPSNTSVSPSSGLVPAGAQTFTTVQRDASGYTDLKCSYLLINDVVSGLGAVYAWYDATTNKLWLRSDDNNAWLGGYAPGSANTLENSRAKLLCSGTTVTGSGPDLTINWAIETKPAMQARKCGIWLYAVDMGGANTGFEKKGEVTFDRAPVNTSLSPSASNSLSAGTKTVLTATYIDPDGHADIRNTYLVLNTALSSFRGISLSYDAAANKLYLRNDLNTAWLGGVAPGSPGGVIENSYCRVDCAATAVERDGNNLRVNWSIEPKSPMVGKTLKAWMYVIDAAGAADGWDEMASYLIGAGGLNVSVSPINTSVMAGFPVTLTTRSGAPNGKAATSTYLLMNTSLNPGGAIYLFYDGPSNKLYLRNDAGSAWLGGHAPGSANTISNNLVTVNCANSTAAMVGDQLEVRWSVQFSQTAVGRTFNVWMYTLDNTGLTDGWDAMGALAAAP